MADDLIFHDAGSNSIKHVFYDSALYCVVLGKFSGSMMIHNKFISFYNLNGKKVEVEVSMLVEESMDFFSFRYLGGAV
jgi:hypothetical protein